jgi:tetratricopeptide (TPR) repeat protein
LLYRDRAQALVEAGEPDAALADYRQCVALAPQHAWAHLNLGNALRAKGQPEEAIAEFREAIRLKPDLAEAHYDLGVALAGKGRVDEAIAEYREAIRLKQDYAEVYCNLGDSLLKQGDYVDSLAMYRKGHELGSMRPGWPYPSAQWVAQAEQLAALAQRLPRLLRGEDPPRDATERLAAAQMCYDATRYAAAARFWAEAFQAQPKLADDLKVQHRYNATCAAALAGCGQGKDADKLDGRERARLRRQALDWLRADLHPWRRLLDTEPDQALSAAAVTQVLGHWLADPDFAGVRRPAALARLPEAERQAWRELWSGVADTLARVQTRTTPEKKPGAK